MVDIVAGPNDPSKKTDDDFVSKYGWYVGALIGAAVIHRALQPNYAGGSAYVIPERPLTTSLSYSRSVIDRWVSSHLQFAEGDTSILQHRQRIQKLVADHIERLPPWQQVIFLEDPKPLVFGISAADARQLEKHHGRHGKNVGGGFFGEDNSLRMQDPELLGATNRTLYDAVFQVGIRHEEGHRLDSNSERTFLQSIGLQSADSAPSKPAWSDRNPRWKKALEAELFAKRDPQSELLHENPALASIRDHLSHRVYSPSAYANEALAQMTAIFNTAYANRKGDWAATNKFMQKEYPHLWPEYLKFIDELKVIANRLNPHISLREGPNFIGSESKKEQRPEPARHAAKSNDSEWRSYDSTDPSLGKSYRHRHAFAESEAAHSFCRELKKEGINAVVRISDGQWYAYVPQSDTESVAQLKARYNIGRPNVPHIPEEPSLIHRLASWAKSFKLAGILSVAASPVAGVTDEAVATQLFGSVAAEFKLGLPRSATSEYADIYAVAKAIERVTNDVPLPEAQQMSLNAFIQWGKKHSIPVEAMIRLNPTQATPGDCLGHVKRVDNRETIRAVL